MPEIVTLPAKTDVAVVEVAKYAVAVGVDDATSFVPSYAMSVCPANDVAPVPPLAIARSPEIVASERHEPLIERHPPVRFRPFANVEVAVVEATFSVETERPPENVLVAVVVALMEPTYRGCVDVAAKRLLAESKYKSAFAEYELLFVPPFAMAKRPEIVERERQVPLIERQPPVRLRPLAKVEVAVVEATLSVPTEIPPTNVEVAVVVALIAPTFSGCVEVAAIFPFTPS